MSTTPQVSSPDSPPVPTLAPEGTSDPIPDSDGKVDFLGLKVKPEDVEFYKALDDKIRAEYEGKLLIWKKTELSDLEKNLDDQVRDMVAKFYEKWKEEQKPLTQDQITQVLSQEYVTFLIKLRPYDSGEELEFTIRELPQAIERKFYRSFSSKLKEYGPKLNAFVQSNLGQPVEAQISSFLDTFDNAFDIMSDTVVLCLNPFGKDERVTKQWVQDNVSSSRQFNILQAQMEVNRLRDFFSQLYRAGQKMESLTKPPSFQALLEHTR